MLVCHRCTNASGKLLRHWLETIHLEADKSRATALFRALPNLKTSLKDKMQAIVFKLSLTWTVTLTVLQMNTFEVLLQHRENVQVFSATLCSLSLATVNYWHPFCVFQAIYISDVLIQICCSIQIAQLWKWKRLLVHWMERLKAKAARQVAQQRVMVHKNAAGNTGG